MTTKELIEALNLKDMTESDILKKVEDCVKRKANVNKRVANNNTPLHIASAKGFSKIVKFLLKQDDIDVYAQNNENKTPLNLAIQNKHTDVQKILRTHISGIGKLYETLLILLLAQKGYALSKDKDSGYRDISIGTEVDVGKEGKFDDVGFRFKDQENEKFQIFVQVKHKQDTKPISSKDLSADNNFKLQQYFISYLNMKEKFDSEDFGRIKYVVLFTTTSLDKEDLEHSGFEVKKAPEDIVNLFTIPNLSSEEDKLEKYYQFKSISNELRDILKESTDFHRVAKVLAKFATGGTEKIMGIDTAPISHYHAGLLHQVIEKSFNQYQDQNQDKRSWEGKFKDDFIDNPKLGTEKDLRDAVLEAIRNIDHSKNNDTENGLKDILKHAKWKLAPNFGGKTQLNNRSEQPNESAQKLPKKLEVTEHDIADFLHNFVFIVKQPDASELLKQVYELHKSSMDRGIEHFLTPLFDKKIDTFRKFVEEILGIDKEKRRRKEKWIKDEQISQFIETETQKLIEPFRMIALTSMYEDEVRQFGKFTNLGTFSESLDQFLESESKYVLHVESQETQLSFIKVIQHLNIIEGYRAEGGRISTHSEFLKKLVNCNKVVEAFKSMDIYKLLIIDYRIPIQEIVLEKLFAELNDILNMNSSKKVIVITGKDLNIDLAQRFRNDQQSERYWNIDDNIELRCFKPKKDPLKERLISFCQEEKKYCLFDLISIPSWDYYLEYLSNEDSMDGTKEIIDIGTLMKILRDEEIKIGSKLLRTCDLEGAYVSFAEDIKRETLINKLLGPDINSSQCHSSLYSDCNLSEKYVISGLVEFEGQELLWNLRAGNAQIEIFNSRLESKSIELFDKRFREEDFRQKCECNPDKKIYWIIFKNSEFILQQLYNPVFYIKRKFRKIIIQNSVKELLVGPQLQDVIFVDNVKKEELMVLVGVLEKEEQVFQNNVKKGKIRISDLDNSQFVSFPELCQQNADHPVHWLTVEGDRLIWKDSHMSLEILRKYKDRVEKHPEIDAMNGEYLWEADWARAIKEKKVVIIADDPGMGKSTTLTQLYNDELLLESHWVIRINLKDSTQALNTISSNNINTNEVVEYLTRYDTNLNNDTVKFILRLALNKNKTFLKMLLIIFDGFDEVLDIEDREKTISLLKFLKCQSKAKLWITTRLHYKETLENKLNAFAFQFNPMDDPAQTEFITKFLKDRTSLILSSEKIEEYFGTDGEFRNDATCKYIKIFKEKMQSIFKENDHKFIGTPLQLYLMLEGCIEHFKQWTEDDSGNPDFSDLGSDILEIYKKFINRKCDIYFKKVNIDLPTNQKQYYKALLKHHHRALAKSLIFRLSPKKSLNTFKDTILAAGLTKTENDKIAFLHPTFCEYFAAGVFINWIKKSPWALTDNSKKIEFLLKVVFMKKEYQLVRVFMNLKFKKMFNNNKLPDESLASFGEIFDKIFREQSKDLIIGELSILHLAIFEKTVDILKVLLRSVLKFRLTLEELLVCIVKNEGITDDNILRVNPYSRYSTPLHFACESANVEAVKILMGLAHEILKTKQYLFHRDSYQQTALHFAVNCSYDNVDTVEELLGIAKKISFETAIELILQPCIEYNYVLTIGLHENDPEEVELAKRSFLQKSALDCACYRGHVEIVKVLLRSAEELTIIEKCLFPDTEKRDTPLIKTASAPNGHVDIAKELINRAMEISFQTKVEFIVYANKSSNSALHLASDSGNIEIVQLLLDEINIDADALQRLLLARNKKSYSALDLAVLRDHVKIVELLLSVSKSIPDGSNKEELSTLGKLIFSDERNSLLESIQYGNDDIFKMLLGEAENIALDKRKNLILHTVEFFPSGYFDNVFVDKRFKLLELLKAEILNLNKLDQLDDKEMWLQTIEKTLKTIELHYEDELSQLI